jgi:hypothetical protein
LPYSNETYIKHKVFVLNVFVQACYAQNHEILIDNYFLLPLKFSEYIFLASFKPFKVRAILGTHNCKPINFSSSLSCFVALHHKGDCGISLMNNM